MKSISWNQIMFISNFIVPEDPPAGNLTFSYWNAYFSITCNYSGVVKILPDDDNCFCVYFRMCYQWRSTGSKVPRYNGNHRIRLYLSKLVFPESTPAHVTQNWNPQLLPKSWQWTKSVVLHDQSEEKMGFLLCPSLSYVISIYM